MRLTLWLAILVSASLVVSLGLGCALPPAAFGAIAALTLRPLPALGLSGTVWLVNAAAAFSLYPHDGGMLTWAAILAGVAMLCTLAPMIVARTLARQHTQPAVIAAAALFSACAVYEAALFVAAASLMGGRGYFTAMIIGRVVAINAIAFVALAAVSALARAGGVRLTPIGAVPAPLAG